MNEPNARLALKLRAKSGFCSSAEYAVSVNQWAAITAICEGNFAALPKLIKSMVDASTPTAVADKGEGHRG